MTDETTPPSPAPSEAPTKVKPVYQQHFENDPNSGFTLLGQIDVPGANGLKGDVYLHDMRGRDDFRKDWPDLAKLAIEVRTGDEDSNYHYSRLDFYAATPVMFEDLVKGKVATAGKGLQLAIEKGLVTEEMIMKAMDPWEVRVDIKDPALKQRIVEANGYKTVDEWEAAFMAKSAKHELGEEGASVQDLMDSSETNRREL